MKSAGAVEAESVKPEGLSVSIAVVDDNAEVGATIASYLKKLQCEVFVYKKAVSFLAAMEGRPVDILISDIRMPGMDGIELLTIVRERSPQTDVVLISGQADKKDAIRALKLGAFDFFEKPVNGTELSETIKRTMRYRAAVQERDRLAEQVTFLSRQEARRWGIEAFVGNSKAMEEILKDIRIVQRASNTSVLITGESGTGKELVARAVHFGGGRKDRPFVPLNCSAVPEQLAESILFGHLRGSFTGATADNKGSFDIADGGTLFLDEIGDMPAAMQAKLLRVLEDGIITPVGGSKGHQVDVRVIAATNVDLDRKVAAKKFRTDLYYRLASFVIHIPPLREREEDVPLLVEHFVATLSHEMGIRAPELSPEAMAAIMGFGFPGNIRELRNLLERALLECDGRKILPKHLRFLDIPGAVTGEHSGGTPETTHMRTAAEVGADENLPLNLKKAGDAVIRKAIARTGGNISAAAGLLGISRAKLYRKMAAAEHSGEGG